AWDLMDPRSYPDLPHQLLHKKFPVAPVMTSRGCPYDCSFCASTALWGRGWRTRSAANVVDEIEMLVRDFDVKEIHFEDDNFTLKASHAAAVCEEILRRGIDIVWACPNGVRIDTLDDDLLELMRRSGCYSLGFGIESGSQAVLEKNNKKLKLDRVADQVRMVKRHGIEAFGFFIIGLPGETADTIRETIRYARRVPIDRANFGLLSPLPGSGIFNEYVLAKSGGEAKAVGGAKSSGEAKSGGDAKSGSEGFDHRVLNYFNPFPIGGLDSRELNRWQRRAVYSFYLRPGPLLKVVRDLRPAQVKQMLRALFDYST
ncbi:MAG: radical SAM protein, partial [Actinomycetota bacterium]